MRSMMPRTMEGIFQMLRTLVAGEDMELMVEHPPPQQNDEKQQSLYCHTVLTGCAEDDTVDFSYAKLANCRGQGSG